MMKVLRAFGDMLITVFATVTTVGRTVDKFAQSGEAVSDYTLEAANMMRDRAALENNKERLELTEALQNL